MKVCKYVVPLKAFLCHVQRSSTRTKNDGFRKDMRPKCRAEAKPEIPFRLLHRRHLSLICNVHQLYVPTVTAYLRIFLFA